VPEGLLGMPAQATSLRDVSAPVQLLKAEPTSILVVYLPDGRFQNPPGLVCGWQQQCNAPHQRSNGAALCTITSAVPATLHY